MSTPIPNRENESRSVGSGPVTTTALDSSQVKFKMTKEQYMDLRKAGKVRGLIAKEHGVSLAGLLYWLGKWGIRDLADEERELGLVPERKKPESPKLEQGIGDDTDSDKSRDIERLRLDVEHWKAQSAGAVVFSDNSAEQYQETIRSLQEELEAAHSRSGGLPERVPGKYEIIGNAVGALVEEKNAAYGDSFAKCGEFLKLLYPDGILPNQFTDAFCLVRIFDKQMRIATQKDAFCESPYRDIVGYGLLGVAKDEQKD